MKILVINGAERYPNGFRAVIYSDESMKKIFDIIENKSESELRKLTEYMYPEAFELSESDRIISKIYSLLDETSNTINSYLDRNSQESINTKINELKTTVRKALKK